MESVRFWTKNAFRSKKVCCKVSLFHNFQRQSCKAFTGLSNCSQMVGGSYLLKRIFCFSSEPSVGVAAMQISTFMKFDEYPSCVALITMQYEIFNNVH